MLTQETEDDRDSQPPALSLRGLTKGFAGTVAVRDLTLDLRGGEVLALVGENGAGKSTLLKMLCGVHQPDAGELVLDGETVRLAAPVFAHRRGIRVVNQEPEIVPGVSVAENVYLGELPRHAGAFSRRRLRDQLERLLADHGLTGALPIHRRGEQLSPAQAQLVEILRAVRPGVRVVAFDEPTTSLTESETRLLFDLVRGLRDAGVAVVYVSHRLAEIFELADRVAVLRDGVLQGVRAAADTDEAEIVRMMVGRDLSLAFDRRRNVGERVVLDVRGLRSHWHDDIDLQVRAGEVVGLAGLVGSGRSELARIVFGDLAAASGEIRIEDTVVHAHGPADLIAAGVGLIPEDRAAEALLLGRSVRDNIALASLRDLRRGPLMDGRAEARMADRYVSELGIVTPSILQEIGRLSGGNQQKAVLARWLVRRPRLLILDEPTRGIDVGAKRDVYRLVDDLAGQGVAILLISSELPELLGIADRIAVMSEGRIAGELTHDEASEEAIMRLAMPHRPQPPRALVNHG